MAKTKVAEKPGRQTGAKVIAVPALKDSKEFKIGSRSIVVSNEDLICTGLLLLLMYIIYSIRSNFLLIPFERDEGIYSYFGNLILDGKTPYKDFYEVKFPGLFYFFATIVAIFGDTVKGMHTGFMYVNMLTALFVYLASRKLFSPIAGIVSATTFAFVSLTPTLSGFTVQAEHGVAFFISIGVYCYSVARANNKWYSYLVMGAAMGMAFMTKTSGIFLAFWGALIILTDWFFTKPRTFKALLINMFSYGGGGILIVASFFLLMASKGVFSDMIFWTYEHPKSYINSMPFEEGVKYFKYTRDAIIQNHKLFWFHSVAAIGLCLLKPANIKLKIFGITLFGLSFMTIVPGYYFYGHYWIQTVPGLSIVAGLTVYSVLGILRTYFKLVQPRYGYIYLGIFAVLTFNHASNMKGYYFHPNYERILRATYGNNPFPESMEIANYINANSKPEDNIVLLGSEPQIYFYTKKRCPSRHAYFTALVNNIPAHHQWQREFAKDVEKAKPKFVIFFNHPLSLLVQPNTDKYVFEWANKFISENYHIVGLVDMIEGQQSVYVYNEKMNTYKPVSQNLIYIYERNAGPSAINTAATNTTTTTTTTPKP